MLRKRVKRSILVQYSMYVLIGLICFLVGCYCAFEHTILGVSVCFISVIVIVVGANLLALELQEGEY